MQIYKTKLNQLLKMTFIMLILIIYYYQDDDLINQINHISYQELLDLDKVINLTILEFKINNNKILNIS